MHVLGEFIHQQMDARGWRQIDLVRESGLTKSVVSRLLSGTELRRMIDRSTIEGLARAFGIDESVIILKSAEAIGVPVDRLGPIIMTAHDVSDDVLLEILRKRLKERGQG